MRRGCKETRAAQIQPWKSSSGRELRRFEISDHGDCDTLGGEGHDMVLYESTQDMC